MKNLYSVEQRQCGYSGWVIWIQGFVFKDTGGIKVYLNIERDESVERNKAKDTRERECLEHSLWEGQGERQGYLRIW